MTIEKDLLHCRSFSMEGPVGLEPTTPCLKGRCSNQLSYGPTSPKSTELGSSSSSIVAPDICKINASCHTTETGYTKTLLRALPSYTLTSVTQHLQAHAHIHILGGVAVTLAVEPEQRLQYEKELKIVAATRALAGQWISLGEFIITVQSILLLS